MTWLSIVGQFLKIMGFITDLWREHDSKKAKEKKELGKELIDALAETNKDTRASRLNIIINKLRR